MAKVSVRRLKVARVVRHSVVYGAKQSADYFCNLSNLGGRVYVIGLGIGLGSERLKQGNVCVILLPFWL